MHKRLTVRLVAASALICLVESGFAANLVTNPDFDTDVSGWSPQVNATSSVTWAASPNRVGSPGSGSAAAANTGSAFTVIRLTQCVSTGITPGTIYDVGAWMRVNTAESGVVGADAFVSFFSAAGCGGNVLSTIATSTAQLPMDTWVLRTASGAAPPSAASAEIFLEVFQQSAGTYPFRSYFDGVLFGPDVLFANGFE